MHRQSRLFAGSLAFAALAAPTAHAAVEFYDGFNYPTGNLAGNAGWTGGNAGNGYGLVKVTTPGLTYTDSAGAQLSNVGNAVTSSGSYTFQVSTSPIGTPVGSATGSSTFYVSFLQNGSGPESLRFNTPTGARVLDFGDTHAFTPLGGGGNFGPGTTLAAGAHFAVLKINETPDSGNAANLDITISYYVDPTLGAPTAAPFVSTYVSGNTSPFQVGQIAVGDTGGAGGSTTFDEFRVGDSYAEVTPSPEPAGLLTTALGLAGTLLRRSRRRT